MTWLDDLTFNTVIVHMKDGPSVKGVRRAVYDDGVVLSEAHVLEPESVTVLNGDLFVPRDNVSFMQLVSS